MRSFFFGFQSNDEIETEYIQERLKKHYMFYHKLIKTWEKKVMKNVKFITKKDLKASKDPDLMRFKENRFELPDIERELKEYLIMGEDKYIDKMKSRLDVIEKEIAYKFLKSSDDDVSKLDCLK